MDVKEQELELKKRQLQLQKDQAAFEREKEEFENAKAKVCIIVFYVVDFFFLVVWHLFDCLL